MAEIVYKELSFQVMSAVYEVHKVLGPGFLEKVYENALVKEFDIRDIPAETQKEISVSYKGVNVGSYYADMLIDGKIIIELKAVDKISRLHEAQLLNYLKATGIKLGYLINMGNKSVEYKRLVY
ncbi:MAG: GxxExxY protein [Zetaproteobacteria bacterium CG_4_10_14_0_2_um_filter_55_20]|nr:MAG: GxxExxY protein [Zetaproteobacteria bacterium CG08_land_8_20_14_0_20_55_17]PIY51462.1 MAG: GxxExxY protein [Zetaproteobacteria bacterium CG_4_10_14_0_8_um_filter_55_43]PIZ39611.1 MAG: GxxExxY protein [Zetaproteobacteria bacterium CG_4_10_14_0_2_um_filter_55_20]